MVATSLVLLVLVLVFQLASKERTGKCTHDAVSCLVTTIISCSTARKCAHHAAVAFLLRIWVRWAELVGWVAIRLRVWCLVLLLLLSVRILTLSLLIVCAT